MKKKKLKEEVIGKEVFDKVMSDFIKPAISNAVTKKIGEIVELKGQIIKIIKMEVRKELRHILGIKEE